MAQTPLVQVSAADSVVTYTASAAYRTAEQEALSLWDAGRQREAMTLLYGQSTDAAPGDAALAKRRLGYMNLKVKNRAEAKRLFLELADMPSGVNDWAKADSALRMTYLEENRDVRRARLERMASGEYRLSNDQSCEIASRLGAMHHADLDLQRALAYFEEVMDKGESRVQRARAKCSQAGLWLELAKGEGNTPMPPEERPVAFERARAICQSVIDDAGPERGKIIPEDREMVAALMYFESFYFEGDYENAYQLGSQFLADWGRDPAKYTNSDMKIYVNTAKTFHVMDCYLTGRYDEALKLATDLVDNPPPAKEHFQAFDALMYGAACGKLACENLGCSDEAARFEKAARDYNAQHFDLLYPALLARRKDFIARTGQIDTNKSVAQVDP